MQYSIINCASNLHDHSFALVVKILEFVAIICVQSPMASFLGLILILFNLSVMLICALSL